jgi:carboxyl-terminal processing protease
MQDYNLALVVGTKSHGKTSIQDIFELKNESNDFIKITIGKFYRVNGKSSQYTGINPTISIPSVFDDQFTREKNAKTALKNESIASYLDNKSYPLSEKQKEIIKTYTAKYKTDAIIQKITKLKTKINKIFGDNLEPVKLNFTSVFDYLYNYTSLWKEIKALSENEYDFTISNTSFDLEKNKNSDYLSNINKVNIKNIQTNFTVFEATKIIGDLK